MSSRRVVIAGFAAAFSLSALAPAVAQQPPQNQATPFSVTPQPTETNPNQGLGSNAQQRQQRTQQGGAPQDTQTPARQGQASAPTQGQQQSQADRQYIQQVLAASTVSLQQSNFALSKAQNPRVKMFAEFEIGEQNNLTDIMHSFADPSATSSTTTGARQAASTAPELPPEDSAAMERLSRAQPGPGFDRDYVAMQIQGHQKLLAIQEGYIKNASNNREALSVARLARGQILEHLALLQDMQKELGR